MAYVLVREMFDGASGPLGSNWNTTAGSFAKEDNVLYKLTGNGFNQAKVEIETGPTGHGMYTWILPRFPIAPTVPSGYSGENSIFLKFCINADSNKYLYFKLQHHIDSEDTVQYGNIDFSVLAWYGSTGAGNFFPYDLNGNDVNPATPALIGNTQDSDHPTQYQITTIVFDNELQVILNGKRHTYLLNTFDISGYHASDLVTPGVKAGVEIVNGNNIASSLDYLTVDTFISFHSPDASDFDNLINQKDEATAPITETEIPEWDLGIGTSPALPPEITVSPIVTDPDGTLKVCLKNALGETVVCGKLPEGSDTPALITIRKDNNYIFVMYQGKIIITYAITEAEFPTLYNSVGWVGFWLRDSNLMVGNPIGSSTGSSPLTGYSYSLFARDLDAPIGYSHPLWLYGRQYQSYSIMFDEADNIRVEQLPIDSELNNSFVFYRGGHRYVINNKYANLIANAGYMRWLEVIDV